MGCHALKIFISRLSLVGAFISKCLTAAFVNFETPHMHPIALSPDNELLAVCNTADYSIEVFHIGNDGIPTTCFQS